ncbi:MAG: YeeE/YedE family protein [Phycisphaerae bacterium]|nr:YeeE/YedE family protein [Phycisphaerae bacterium]MBM90325.1 YeeE/YedE family protein [Phycisphaerae bacterium]|tara:strand:+ start:1318 stop:1884 length:567 start_codon:yes stop_codon:yes gene_type:complete
MNAWFADPTTLLLGSLTGLVFGFLLFKGGVASFDVIVNQFRLKDFTVLKVMLTAIIVGGLGIYSMRAMGMDIPLHVKGTELLANTLGGLIFGVGMVILGYCPGTGVAAIGAGSRHAIVGVLGMLVGAGIYAEMYPWLNTHILKVGSIGKVTIPDQIGISPFVLLVPLAIGAVLIMPRLGRKQSSPPTA